MDNTSFFLYFACIVKEYLRLLIKAKRFFNLKILNEKFYLKL
ncbi:hypothetical protein DJ66_0699 [Candidatus Liberibacter solanacearum]|uniref:Uncharacterized protein n=1 Tax=Candidatus Liberibacter solanacearum TaxID=556287 RepID=A0A0F4VKQ2_9HYPH|nr:hypothetical protein DJ66_0699 [Candidatus Liberibacter solanacearum]